MSGQQEYILLLLDKNQEPHTQDLKCKMSRGMNCPIPLEPRRVFNTDLEYKNENHRYCEFLLELNCDFSTVDEERILNRFCDSNLFNGLGESWLCLDSAFSFHNLKTSHHNSDLKSFSFGSIVGFNNYVEHYNTLWSAGNAHVKITNLHIEFEHHLSKFFIKFLVANSDRAKRRGQDGRSHRLYMLEVLYSMIKRILIKKREGPRDTPGTYELYLVMTAAPLVKRVQNPINHSSNMNRNQSDQRWRQRQKSQKFKVLDVKDVNEFPFVNVKDAGIHTQFKRDIEFGNDANFSDEEDMEEGKTSLGKKREEIKKMAYCSGKVLGMSRTLKLELCGEHAWEAIEQLVNCCRDQAKVFFTPMTIHRLDKEVPVPTLPSSQFSCFYALKCLFSSSFQMTDELWLHKEKEEVNKMLDHYLKEDPVALELSLYDIHHEIDQGNVIKLKRALEILYVKHHFNPVSLMKTLPDEMVQMRRAILTPTRFIFLPPVPQMKSFLLRSSDPEYALRVTIRDDNFDQLTFTVCGSKESKEEFLEKFICRKLIKGFKLGKRNYEFFGSSTSQLREHGCFFFAQDSEGRTAEMLRQSVGDVHSIDRVPKFMARLGQSLSQSIASVQINKEWVEGPIDDITLINPQTRKVKYIFSDGVGKVSREITEMIYTAMKLSPDDRPSAFQFRYGGCKGMLVLDPTLTGKKLVFRKSQWKFDSEQDSLEILKVSRPQKAFLNRPFITILEQMGIDKEVFFKLQSREFNKLIGSLIDSRDAMHILKERATLRLPYEKLHNCGIDLAVESFFRPLVTLLYKRGLAELKHKARIQIPFEESRTMFGVLDETNTLEYGQVFFQYSEYNSEGMFNKQPVVYTGTVLINKNPCMHPGDVRKFIAVDVPTLHHIKDCLVFPAKGPRPHPNEMAGSDLDGDEYTVIWYDDLIFERANHEAMDYSNDNQEDAKTGIEVEDMARFMCRYILDDCVGLIASAHLAWADTKGIFDPICMSIAKKYSVTLDFAKTGKPDTLDQKERVKLYPDFMEKNKEKSTYPSRKALGTLFNNCKRIELVSEVISDELLVEKDEDFNYPGWEEYHKNAQQSLKKYSDLLLAPSKMFHLKNEGEILSGAVKKIEKSFQGKNAKENLELVLDTIVPRAFNSMNDWFFQEFISYLTDSGLIPNDIQPHSKQMKAALNAFVQSQIDGISTGHFSLDENMDKMLKKASAWYNVAYDQGAKDGACLGLPWTVSHLLILLKTLLNKRFRHRQLDLKINRFLEQNKSQQYLIFKDFQDPMQQVPTFLLAWINYNKSFLTLRNIKYEQVKTILIHEFNSRIQRYLDSCRGTVTVGYLLVSFLKEITHFCCNVPNLTKALGNLVGVEQLIKKELGFLAVIGLSSLAAKGELWQMGPDDCPSDILNSSILFKDYREVILLPFPLGDKACSEMNKIFENMLKQREGSIRKVLSSYSKVKAIETDFIQRFTHKGELWFLVITAYGKIWNLELLKDFVIQPNMKFLLTEKVKNIENQELWSY